MCTLAFRSCIPYERLPMAEESVIVGMRADPEPEDIPLVFHGKRPVVQADPDGPEASDLPKVQGWMAWVLA
jgi:hypothetical protein